MADFDPVDPRPGCARKLTVSAGPPLMLIFAVGTGQALETEFFLFEDRPSVSVVCSWSSACHSSSWSVAGYRA
jgi:hypothetical protein